MAAVALWTELAASAPTTEGGAHAAAVQGLDCWAAAPGVPLVQPVAAAAPALGTPAKWKLAQTMPCQVAGGF